ncbi:phage tail protein [Sulfuriferula sp. AH1]|uniref:phage baseplate assembly protein n=1 Tax=Sulfuriferula sp. AH1 TaxID=1985873 RepID=UPI000B3B0D8F|nr:phage tail protein [Sulfuriferula sp. AH1]ARU30905.1 phage tail protein [Sulfuriferula sp. AH1]
MPTPADKVQLLIGGKMHEDWEDYDVDSDLLIPADAWHVTMGMRGGQMPPDVVVGAPAEVRVGGETVMIGRIDDIDDEVSKTARTFSISGRDKAANLVDCSAPVFVARMSSLADIMAKVVRPLGITKIRIDADATRTREKINVEPGDSAWDALSHIAEANGLWPWFDPDGTLVIGGPDYAKPEVATLILRKNGKGNNVLSLAKQEAVNERYSEITVLGQTHGTATETGKHALRATARDTNVSWYRPKIVVDHEADNTAVCLDRARKLLADSRLHGFTLQATVKGHRIVAPGQPAGGKLWTPGQRVRVFSEPHGIDGVFFLMARKFRGGRASGSRTELTLKEDGVWVLDAHPHKGKHRRGKNSAPGQIIDLTGAAA